MKLLKLCLILFVVFFVFGCTDDDEITDPNPEMLDHNYIGTLYLRLTNTYPEFDETSSVTVEVNKYGIMTFGTGTLNYDGDTTIPQTSRFKRSGILTLRPGGHYKENNNSFEVDENTTVVEQFQQWIWNNGSWLNVVDETVNNVWNGGLVFYLDEAVINGSVVEVTNAQGSVKWTLVLAVSP